MQWKEGNDLTGHNWVFPLEWVPLMLFWRVDIWVNTWMVRKWQTWKDRSQSQWDVIVCHSAGYGLTELHSCFLHSLVLFCITETKTAANLKQHQHLSRVRDVPGLWSQAINLAPARPCVSRVIPPCLIGGNSLYHDHPWTRNPPRKLQFCLLTLLPFCSSLLYRNVHFVFQCFSVLSDFPIYFTYNHYDVFSAG